QSPRARPEFQPSWNDQAAQCATGTAAASVPDGFTTGPITNHSVRITSVDTNAGTAAAHSSCCGFHFCATRNAASDGPRIAPNRPTPRPAPTPVERRYVG